MGDIGGDERPLLLRPKAIARAVCDRPVPVGLDGKAWKPGHEATNGAPHQAECEKTVDDPTHDASLEDS